MDHPPKFKILNKKDIWIVMNKAFISLLSCNLRMKNKFPQFHLLSNSPKASSSKIYLKNLIWLLVQFPSFKLSKIMRISNK